MGYVFDFVVLFVLLGCAVIGFKRGFVLELFDLLALIFALCFARGLDALGIRVTDLAFESDYLGAGLSFLIEFVLAFVGTRVVGYLIHRRVKKSQLKGINRYMGSGLAFLKAYVVLSIIVFILIQFPVFGTGWMKQSICFPLLRFGGRLVRILLPGAISKAVNAG